MKRNIFIQSCVILLAIIMSSSAHARLIGFDYNNLNPQLVAIDTTTGQGHAFAPIDPDYWIIKSLAYDLNHDILYAVFPGSDDQLFKINPHNGEIESIGHLQEGFNSISGLAYDTKRNILYGKDRGEDQLVSIDVNTGLATAIGPTGIPRLSSLAYDSKRDKLFSVPDHFGSPILWSIDRETGESTRVGLLGFDVEGVWGLTYHPEEDVLYGVDLEHDYLVRIDPDTAQATPVGTPGTVGFDTISGLTFIPEPTTALTLLLASTLLFSRRKQHANN